MCDKVEWGVGCKGRGRGVTGRGEEKGGPWGGMGMGEDDRVTTGRSNWSAQGGWVVERGMVLGGYQGAEGGCGYVGQGGCRR